LSHRGRASAEIDPAALDHPVDILAIVGHGMLLDLRSGPLAGLPLDLDGRVRAFVLEVEPPLAARIF